jgi:large subunit ribosomal protein L25
VPDVSIAAEPRSDFGKGAARRLRRSGSVPAVIYGDGNEVRHVSLPGHDLMLALKKPKVTLAVQYAGGSVTVAPRQVQRDPVRQIIEHVDLVVITAAEARERAAEAEAIVAAEAAAEEAGLDPIAVAEATSAAIESGLGATEAIAQALAAVEEAGRANAAAAAAAAAAEDAAEAAVAAESGAGEVAASAEAAAPAED